MITGKTSIVGIIGNPVEHSMSPVMHNAAFKYLNLDYVYVPFLVENLEDAVIGASALNIKGLNITIPYKKEVIKYIDKIDESAELIGAVNTIKFDKGHIKGFNTDGIGAVKAIEEISSIKDKNVIILGAGGAARAIAFQILIDGAKSLIIANRTPENAIKLQNDIKEKLDVDVKTLNFGLQLEDEIKDADILINTTPIGMYPHANQKPLVKASTMHPNLIVNDIVYNPLKTGLLKEAEKAGARPVSGIKMLIYQGMKSFEIWTGVYPPFKIFENALKKY